MVELKNHAIQSDLLSRTNAEIIIETVLMVIITMITLLGNMLICWTAFRIKKLRTIPNFYYIVLAISNILMATLCMPLSVEVLVTSKWTKSFNACQFQGFFYFFLAFASLQIMTAMAINRFYRVVRPSLYGKYFSIRRTIASIVIIVALASFGAGLSLICNASYTLHHGKAVCFTTFKTPEHDKWYILFTDICFIALPILVISICYQQIFRTVSNHRKSLKEGKKSRSDQQLSNNGSLNEMPKTVQRVRQVRINIKEIKITKTLFITFLGFTVCWSPVVVIDMIDLHASHNLSIPRQVFLLWSYMVYGSSFINPFIYGILNKSFRNEFLMIFRLRCRKNKVELRQ